MTLAELILAGDDRTQQAFASVERSLGKLSAAATRLNGLFAGIGAIAIGGAFITAAKNALDFADNLNDLSKRTGVSVENLSALDVIAQQSGTTIDEVATRMGVLAQKMRDGADIFGELGLSVRDTGGQLKNLGDFSQEVARKIANINNETERAAVARAAFGKSGDSLLPFLEELARAGKLNATVTREQAEAADRFNDNLVTLQKSFQSAALGLATEMLPRLTEFIERLNAATAASGSLAQGLKFAFLGDNAGAAKRLAEVNRQLEALNKNFPKDDPKRERSLLEPKIRALETERRTLIALQNQQFERLSRETVHRAPTVVGESEKTKRKRSGGGKPAPTAEDIARAEALQRHTALVQDAVAVLESIRSPTEQYAIELSKLNALYEGGYLGIEQYVSALELANTKLDDATGVTAAHEEALDRHRAKMEELAQIYLSTREPIEQYTDEVKRLRALHAEGLLDDDTFTRAFRRANEDFSRLTETAKTAADQTSEFFAQAARNIQDVMGDALFDLMEGRITDLGEAFSRMLNRMVADALSAQIGNALFGPNFGSTGSTAGGLLGNVLPFLFGAGAPSVATPPFVPQLARGTDFVPRDMVAMLHRGEAVVPAAQNTRGAPHPLAITINVPQGTSRDSAAQIARQTGRAVQTALARFG